jgi:hypothetical protein
LENGEISQVKMRRQDKNFSGCMSLAAKNREH